MADIKEHLADWLRDAYAMENQAIEMQEKLAKRLDDYPEIRDKILRDNEDSKKQAEKLEQCLMRLGKNTSAFKTGLGKLVGTAQALSGLFVQDEVVKGCVAAYVFKHYEIGNYKVLVTAANAAGEHEIARICGEIMQEEEGMAKMMEKMIPVITQKFLGAYNPAKDTEVSDIKNSDENAKNPDWKVPQDLPSVKPGDYDASIGSARGSAHSAGTGFTLVNDNDPARQEQKRKGQMPLHDEEIGGA